jgi:hypothetical protein
MEKNFNQKINYFVWTHLGNRVDIKIILFYKFTLRFKQFDIILIICINDTRGTGGIFAASVVDTGSKFVVDTCGAPSLANISATFREKDDSKCYFKGLGGR